MDVAAEVVAETEMGVVGDVNGDEDGDVHVVVRSASARVR